MSKITMKNIEKSFGEIRILNGINFEVNEGEFVSLLGPSGCGKTTTLKLIAGLILPDKGEVFLGNQNITNWQIEKRGAVIVFQNHLLFPHLNVEQNIGFGLKMAKCPKNEIKAQVEKMIKLVKLERMNHKYPHQLSGGQQQRIALARALAIEPKVLLLDEPFSSLDRKLREDMGELTLDIQRELKITTVLVTHDKEEALMYSDRIAMMLDGQIKQFGTPEELYQRPNSIEVANFLGEKNYISGYIENEIFISEIVKFHIEKAANKLAMVMIKPEDIEIFPEGIKRLEGTIQSKKYAGERIYYSVLVKGIVLKVISQSLTLYHEGDKVTIEINLNNLQIF